jgi:hypothetical protein
MRKVIGYSVALVAGVLVLKFVFGPIWTAVKLGLAAVALGAVIYLVRRWRQAAFGGSGAPRRLGAR